MLKPPRMLAIIIESFRRETSFCGEGDGDTVGVLVSVAVLVADIVRVVAVVETT
jgi:hypothetical protein